MTLVLLSAALRRAREEPKEKVIKEGEIQTIEIPLITLVWSLWFPWEEFEIDLR